MVDFPICFIFQALFLQDTADPRSIAGAALICACTIAIGVNKYFEGQRQQALPTVAASSTDVGKETELMGYRGDVECSDESNEELSSVGDTSHAVAVGDEEGYERVPLTLNTTPITEEDAGPTTI